MVARFRRAVIGALAIVITISSVGLVRSLDARRRRAADRYYLARRERLLRQFRQVVRRVRPLLVTHFGDKLTDEMVAQALSEFNALIPRLPYVGGVQPLTQFVVATGWFLALYRAAQAHGISLDESGHLFLNLAKAYLDNYPGMLRGLLGRINFSPGYVRGLQRRALESQKRRFPDGYVFTFVPGDGQTFDYGVDYTECAACKFLAREGASEIAPYLCPIDRIYSEKLGWGLTRTMTIAEGYGKCDFRFKRGAPTHVASRVIPQWSLDGLP